MTKSILDQRSLKKIGVDWRNDELIVLALTIFVILRLMNYV
jgi:hypothetical protein